MLATLFCLIAFTNTVLSQKVQEEPGSKDQIEHQDVVYLKDGSILRGKITEWSFGEKLSITILGGIKMEILDADIQGCFDNISHDWMLSHIPMNRAILKKWLKAG